MIAALRSLTVTAAVFAALRLAEAQGLPPTWEGILERARGQDVYWNAWAGDEPTNAFIAWVGRRVKETAGVNLVHVKLSLTAEAVSRVVAEKAAGRHEGGSIDLIWINGENFLAMKEQGLLFGPFTHRLPHFGLVDTAGKPSTVIDFTVPTEGYESPWRMARIVYVYDAARLPRPPRSIPAMLDWARANPGRITHPRIRNFLGSTFLKQALYELIDDPGRLVRPVGEEEFLARSAPLWRWYEELKPLLWRRGEQFPESGPAMRALLADGEIDIMISFNPNEATAGIARGILPPTVRTFVLERGTIGNTSFVAIPYNARHKEGALVVADFLLTPESQARAMHPEGMGNPTVLDLDRLAPEDRRRFAALPRGVATLSPEELGRALPEPHPSWMNRIVAEWERRYSR